MDDFERGKRLGSKWFTPLVFVAFILIVVYFSGGMG